MINIQGRTRTVLLIVGIGLLLFLMWFFAAIVSYIIISLVLSLIGRPIMRFLLNLKIGRFHFSRGIAAMVTLLLVWCFIVGSIRFLIPLLINEFQELSSINMNAVIHEVQTPLQRFMKFTGEMPTNGEERSFVSMLGSQLGDKFDFSKLADVFTFVAGTVGEMLIGAFSVSFITFFFLKEEDMFKDGMMLLVPARYESKVMHVLESIYDLLKRYFIGLVLEIIMVGILVTAGLTIIGLGFTHAVVVGLFCGLFNIIPYLGPWMGAVVGLLIGVATNIQADFMSHTLPVLGLMLIVFITVQILDNVLFQPLIYSSSVKAHPLEIFLVILIAGNVAGVLGMILAIPTYTILRVVGKEFFDKFKIVRRLTRGLNLPSR